MSHGTRVNLTIKELFGKMNKKFELLYYNNQRSAQKEKKLYY